MKVPTTTIPSPWCSRKGLAARWPTLPLAKRKSETCPAPRSANALTGYGGQVWDVDGKEYFDFLSAYSAVNQVMEPHFLRVHQTV